MRTNSGCFKRCTVRPNPGRLWVATAMDLSGELLLNFVKVRNCTQTSQKCFRTYLGKVNIAKVRILGIRLRRRKHTCTSPIPWLFSRIKTSTLNGLCTERKPDHERHRNCFVKTGKILFQDEHSVSTCLCYH